MVVTAFDTTMSFPISSRNESPRRSNLRTSIWSPFFHTPLLNVPRTVVIKIVQAFLLYKRWYYSNIVKLNHKKFISFLTSAILGVFIILGIVDDDFLRIEHVLSTITLLTLVLGITLSMIPDENYGKLINSGTKIQEKFQYLGMPNFCSLSLTKFTIFRWNG